MTHATLALDHAPDGTLTVTLNRPEKRNALCAAMIEELTALAADVAAAPPRAVILRGAGPVFCAGGDLDWMRAQIGADRATRLAAARRLASMLRALNEMPAPLIGQIHGGAFGGGVGLACICDVTIAERGTRFGLTETRLGLIPATIAPYVIARMGEGRARRVFMSSRIFDAGEAVSLGIAARAVAATEMTAAVAAEVAPYAATYAGAVARAKALARALGPRIDEAVIEDSVQRLADAWESPDAAEEIARFFAGPRG